MTDQQKQKLDNMAWCALTSREAVYQSFEKATDVLTRNVSGSIVECGVFAGAQVSAMWYAANQLGQKRTFHLFDSFEGIPVAGPRDGEDIANLVGRGDELRTSGKSACSLEQVKHYLSMAGVDLADCVFHKGWFQDTLPGLSIAPIALLRLDGDLYESTKVCLDNLYPQMASGGIVIVDDWRLQGCRAAVEEYLDAKELTPSIVVEPCGPAWWRS